MSRPARIALVTESFDPRLTGAAGTVRQVANRLLATGHEVRILTAGQGPPSYHAVGVSRFSSPRRGHKIHESLHGFGPDLVHAFTPGAIGIRALRQAGRLGIPTMVTETSARAEFAPPRWREQVADRADRLTVTATWLRERLDAEGLAAALWAPGVDTDVFTPGAGTRCCAPPGPTATSRRSSSATSAACTDVTAYVAWPSSPPSPAPGSW